MKNKAVIELDNKPIKNHFDGHRERLRSKFIENGADSLFEYELLELFLFMIIPRKDVKPLAKELLATFGNIHNIFNADESEITKLTGISKRNYIEIKTIRAICEKIIFAQIDKKNVLNNWEKLVEYLKISMGDLKIEQVRVLFLSKSMSLIKDEVQNTGSVDNTPFYVREILKRAMELAASNIIVVHNHPSGDPTPSVQDINITKKLIEGANALNIHVIDHLIIVKGRHVSFRNLQLI